MSSAPRAARVARRAYLLLARRREAAIRVSLAFASSAPVGADAVSSELFAPGLGPLVLLIEPAPMARLCSRVIPPAPQLANSALVRGQRPERLRRGSRCRARPARGEKGVRGWGAGETRISADWDLFLARELAIRPCNSPHCCCQS